MMGYNWGNNALGYYPTGGGIFAFIVWVLVIVLLVALIRLVWKKGSK